MVVALAGGLFALGCAWLAVQLAVARQKLAAAHMQNEAYVSERDKLEAAKERAEQAHYHLEKQLALIEQDIKNQQKHMENWTSLQDNMLQAAKAAVVGAGHDISNKLLEDHKREAAALKKEQEELARKSVEQLMAQMKTLGESVATLKQQHESNDKRVSNMIRMLSSPAGAGRLSEIGLENSLKMLGLEPGRDFALQYVVSDGQAKGLRPDCLIFLPQNQLMVIDSKSSRLLGDFAEIDSPEKEEQMVAQLAVSMNRHLKDLLSRDYEAAIRDEYARAGKGSDISMMWNIMYLPSESLIEKLTTADPAFRDKCAKARILLAGPTGLAGYLLMACYNIETARQSENQGRIMQVMREILDQFATSLGHMSQMGRNLRTTANAYEKFTRHANRTLLPKLISLSSLGVKPTKSKEIPAQLPSFEVHGSDELLTIEGDSEQAESMEKPRLSLAE